MFKEQRSTMWRFLSKILALLHLELVSWDQERRCSSP